MRMMLAGVTTLIGCALTLPVAAQSISDEIQNEEDPGSEIEMDVGKGGNVTIGREKNLQAPQGVQVNPYCPTSEESLDHEVREELEIDFDDLIAG